jgi:H+/gluconate symporter-like permease
VMADDATGIHDRFTTLGARNAMLGLGLACLIVLTGWLLFREAAVAGRVPRLLIFAGLAALVLAVGVRLVAAASALGADLDATTRAVAVAGEQGLDFGGWVLVASGLAVLLSEPREPRVV